MNNPSENIIDSTKPQQPTQQPVQQSNQVENSKIAQQDNQSITYVWFEVSQINS